MAPKSKYLFIASMDVDPSKVSLFNDVYNTEHCPELGKVAGVGNIYASESLFRAGIRPGRAAGRVTLSRYEGLLDAIRQVLSEAIEAGGTTLRDYSSVTGEPGYFEQSLDVYERADHPCVNCATPIRRKVIGQRASYYCPRCQS